MSLLRLCISYSTRSLRRGGQRTLLAVFCIGVGVMAVVALRLAGDMVATSLTSNVRELLGGDVAVQSTALPLTKDELSTVGDLQRQGLVDGYVALGTERGAVQTDTGPRAQLQLFVVDDPAHFPLVGSAAVDRPGGGRIPDLLARPGGVLLSSLAAQQANVDAGGSVHLTLTRGGGGVVAVAGVLPNRVVAGNPYYLYISRSNYDAVSANPTPRYGLIDILQPDPVKADHAAAQLRVAYPSASVQTLQDALDQNVQASTDISQFLEIVGLLALLIGGIGVVNTMQVSLRRRRVEIAMLKTAGYRRRELYALFGTEAALLGIGGGVLGSLAGIGVSAVVKTLIERVSFVDISFSVNPGDVLSGLLVGLCTAFIFGLLPIVRAADIRPAVVLRDTPGQVTTQSAIQSAALYLALVVLFGALAASLIGSVGIAILVVLLTVIAIAVLGAVFWLIVFLVGRIPVPERVTPAWVIGALITAVITVAVTRHLGAVGVALGLVVVAAVTVVAMPRRIKTGAKLALRSLRRARARTATTLVALFIGIFGVGLILVLGQDIRDKINTALDSLSGYSVYAVASPQDAATVVQTSATLPGLQSRRITSDIATLPTALDGRPVQVINDTGGTSTGQGQRGTEGQFRLGGAAGVEGFDLGGGEIPDPGTITAGRALAAVDAGTLHVIAPNGLRNSPALLHVGSTITLQQPTSKQSVTVTIVGFYTPARIGSNGVRFQFFYQPLLGDRHATDALAGSASNPDLQTTVALQLDPATKVDALKTLQQAAPRVYILDIADFAGIVSEILNNLVILLVALASLSVLAGIVIIANTVALAMLERRREIGILKAVGHSSRSVLAQVLLENAVVGAIGALAGMTLVTVVTGVLADHFFQSGLPVGTPIVVVCVGGMVGLVVLVASLVAWSPTRVRPIEVLRYE